jgi:hydroxymethylbilane synthase
VRAGRPEILQWLAPLHDARTTLAVSAERAVSRALGGSCQVPLGAFAEFTPQGELALRAFIASVDGATVLRSEGAAKVADGDVAGAEALGQRVAQALIDAGGLALVPPPDVKG